MTAQKGAEWVAFNAAYAALNASQKRAVDATEGPVMVIAGPGTGKTQVLALRIVNIIRTTDTAPESILALTFTDAGAANMRERLRTFLGQVAYQVPIFTFHGFCEHLIARYPEAYDRLVGGRLATDIERATMIESILENGSFTHLRRAGNPVLHIPKIQSQITELKREAISPDVLAGLIHGQEANLLEVEQYHQKGAHKGKQRGEYTELAIVIERNRELLAVYRQYEALLRSSHRYDYDDMVLETIAALEGSEDLLLGTQEQYQYVLADEHQDVNGSQNRILELITSFHESPNLFVVGDEKQAIYRFQGASLENFLHFEQVYKGTTTISLTENYRSGQPVLDLAQSLIAVEEGPLAALRTPLSAQRGKAAEVTLTSYPSVAHEADAVAERIAAELRAGTSPAEVAVIVRTNLEVEVMAERLRAAAIAVSASADRDVLTHPITTSVISLLEAVVYPARTRALIEVLHAGYTGINRSDLVRLLAAQTYDTPLESLVGDDTKLSAVGVHDPVPITRLMTTLKKARADSGITAPHRVLAHLVSESGLRDYVVTKDAVVGVRLLRRLYDEAEAMVRRDGAATLEDLLVTFERYRRYGISLAVSTTESGGEYVRVMTAHKAKGLEFEVVFAPNLTDTTWGGKDRKSYFTLPVAASQSLLDAFDDQRRLLYVVMTRAKRTLNLSHANMSVTGKELSPSRLVHELDLSGVLVTEDAAETFNPVAVLTERPALEFPTETVAQLFKTRGFSATSFGNYRKSPWTFVYQNLLRVPDVQSESLLFGTAVHSVLEAVATQYERDRTITTVSELTARIGTTLGRLPLTTSEYTRLHEKALAALVVYIESFAKSLSAKIETERKLTVTMPTSSALVPEIILTGKLDRLDFDEAGQLVRVLDYKTGKAKTRGDIAGTTKSSDGAYKRQLVFYALVLELTGDERLNSKTGTISFVQPNKHGAIVEETFVITDDEIAMLKTELTEAAEAIVSGSYVHVPCDPAECTYCSLLSLE